MNTHHISASTPAERNATCKSLADAIVAAHVERLICGRNSVHVAQMLRDAEARFEAMVAIDAIRARAIGGRS